MDSKSSSRLKKFTILGVSSSLVLIASNRSYAIKPLNNPNNLEEQKVLSPIKLFPGVEKLPVKSLDSEQVANLAKNHITLNFYGASCTYIAGKGCVVTSSGKGNYRVGTMVKTYSIAPSNPSIHQSAFSVSCSWCGFAGDFLGIVVFVVTAPASAPATLVFATYTVGIGFILSYA
jgi:hypothetical protein